MARAKREKKAKKEIAYVASQLNINYSIPVGLTGMLAKATKTNDKEVWCSLSDLANICAARLVGRLEAQKSRPYFWFNTWTTQTFPGSTIKLRLDMSGQIQTQSYDYSTRQNIVFDPPKMSFTCRVKVSGTTSERFTQAMINDYITDKILLGDFEGLEDEEPNLEGTGPSEAEAAAE